MVNKFDGVLIGLTLTLGIFITTLAACTPETTVAVKGDRSLEQIGAGEFYSKSYGKLKNTSYFIVRDKDTGVDYLVILDAGTIKLDPKSKVEK